MQNLPTRQLLLENFMQNTASWRIDTRITFMQRKGVIAPLRLREPHARRIFCLLNGKRNLLYIAELLHIHEIEVANHLMLLVDLGLIVEVPTVEAA